MQSKTQKKDSALFSKRKILIAGGLVALIACMIVALTLLTQPERSVANFCKVAKEEKSSFKSNTAYEKLLVSFKKIDQVAPEEIHPDTSLIVKGYESIASDPSEALSTELGISNSQMRVSSYITANCPDF